METGGGFRGETAAQAEGLAAIRGRGPFVMPESA